jgi:hypothetical protein
LLGGVIGAVTEETITTGMAVVFIFGEIGGITVDMESHVAGVEADESIKVGCTIAEELGDGLGCSLSALGLGQHERTESNDQGQVNSPSIVEKGANDFLEEFDGGAVKGV